jgi:DNA repair photolyase
MDEAIRKTPWRKWKNEEVLMSSTHDPYLPMLAQTARRILERALASGVKVCIQTRSPLVMNDFDLLTKYKDRIRLQISIATKQSAFSKTIETRVASPEARLNIIRKAKKLGLRTGVILAPIFPPLKARPDLNHDLDSIMEELKSIGPDNIYGECIHIRGRNGSVLGRTLGMNTGGLRAFDLTMKSVFTRKLRNHGLKGTWWPEHTHVRGIGSVSR